jgi:hypothetical protein
VPKNIRGYVREEGALEAKFIIYAYPIGVEALSTNFTICAKMDA